MLKVDTASLDWALTHVTARGDTDIFPLPFEFSAIKANWDEVRGYLAPIIHAAVDADD